jgi:cytochrome c553
MGDLERIIARRSELDTLAEELAKQLQEVQAEREELLVAERVLNRLAEAETAKLADRGWLHKQPDGRFTARR